MSITTVNLNDEDFTKLEDLARVSRLPRQEIMRRLIRFAWRRMHGQRQKLWAPKKAVAS
jgi:predicted transcriptional regulator